MSQVESSSRIEAEPPAGKCVPWGIGSAARTALIQGLILVALAFTSAWLLQRRDLIAESRHLAVQARAQAELVARSAESTMSPEQAPKLLRALECAVRAGGVVAGAVVDSSGTILAHTDLSRTGSRIDLHGAAGAFDGAEAAEVGRQLFGKTSGTIAVQPVLGKKRAEGAVALAYPERTFATAGRGLLLYLLPAALVLTAFLAAGRSTVRSALKPASINLDRLAAAIDLPAEPSRREDWSAAQHNRVIGDAAERIESLMESNDELTLTNRLSGFENARMKMILDHFPDGLIVTNLLGEIMFINRRAVRTLDLDINDGAGWGPDKPPAALFEMMREVDKSGQLPIGTGAGGTERQVLCSRVPLTSSGGKIIGALYAMRDMTAQNAAARAQSEFLSQITHELKTPLNTITAYLERLASGEMVEQEKRREFYNAVSAEAARMAQLIGNLFQLSRIQMGNLSAGFNLIRLGPLITGRVESLRIQAEEAGVDISSDIPENLPSVKGDKDLLGVAVTNVISNAIKYTPAGGRITLRATEIDEGVAIEIRDTGAGIPEEIRSKIFERFFRSEQEAIRCKPGSGLGLSLVKEIADLHNGRVTVESRLGSGSRFVIWLPAIEINSRLETARAAA